jgi:uncharacterized protein (TIGR03437 family)
VEAIAVSHVTLAVEPYSVVTPRLLSADGSGQGLAAAVVQRVKADDSQSYEPVAQFDAAQNIVVPMPIDLGPEGDLVFLLLYGTGIRDRSSLSAVDVKIGGVDTRVSYAGPQGAYERLDQVNVLVPRGLIGRGEVDVVLTVDGQVANTVTVYIQ